MGQFFAHFFNCNDIRYRLREKSRWSDCVKNSRGRPCLIPCCLTNFDATGYFHLGAGSNDTSACEISQANPADLVNIPKFIYT